jgi:hypothetical protein
MTGAGDMPVNVSHAIDVMAVLLAGIRSSVERRA